MNMNKSTARPANNLSSLARAVSTVNPLVCFQHDLNALQSRDTESRAGSFE
jgi:hypothetical protein